jgi:hypothetical protein
LQLNEQQRNETLDVNIARKGSIRLSRVLIDKNVIHSSFSHSSEQYLSLKYCIINKPVLKIDGRPIRKLSGILEVYKQLRALRLVPSGTSVKIGTIQRRLAWPLREG